MPPDEGSSALVLLAVPGFAAKAVSETVTDRSKSGVVLKQTPAGGSRARKGATVTIVVGVLGQTTTPTTPTTPTTTTTTTPPPASG